MPRSLQRWGGSRSRQLSTHADERGRADGRRNGSPPSDRRAPVRSTTTIATDPKQLRGKLEAIKRDLDGVDAVVSRKVVLLVGVVVDEWLRHSLPARESMLLEVAVKDDAVQVKTAIPDWDGEQGFWATVAGTASVGLVDRWGIDQRRPSGAWFEIDA